MLTVLDSWAAEISPEIGYAIAMTHTEAVVWHYPQQSSPTEALPVGRVKLLYPTTHERDPLPLGVLIPTSSEPAVMIIIPSTGKVTYWDDLSSACSIDPNRQRQTSVQAVIGGMSTGERVLTVVEAEPRGFVLSFSTGRLAHLYLNEGQGRPSINIKFMASKSTGWLGSLRDSFPSFSSRQDIAAVRSGTSKQRGQRFMISCTSSGLLQTWDLSWNGTHSLVHEVDAKAELVHGLFEGDEDSRAEEPHNFEVLDFIVKPPQANGKAIANRTTSVDSSLLFLTVMKGAKAFNYALIGATLTDEDLITEVVHPIRCFKAPLSEDVSFKPRVMLPQSSNIAVIAFRNDLVVASLIEAEETPNAQIQLEAHVLPEPLQDAVGFRNNKGYEVVGCATELADRFHNPSCVVAVHNFGLIRIATSSEADIKSPLAQSGSCSPVRTRIEQAVFFGTLEDNLLDFSPRPEVSSNLDDIEKAALEVSHSITSSASGYIINLAPSMEEQMASRARALSNLIQCLQAHYPRMKASTRWRLLWNAEKMAAGQALWHWYNSAASNVDNGPRDVFTELIEAIPEHCKLENQPEDGEADSVRHWFIHDVWRIEYLIPYSHEIIELLFQEGIDDRKELDLIHRALVVNSSVEVQLTVLENAFKFRSDNSEAYGIQPELLEHGVLVEPQSYETLSEFWTSATLGGSVPLVPTRIKELLDVSREMAKLLATDIEEVMERNEDAKAAGLTQEDADIEYPHAVMTTLAKKGPRQIEVCHRAYLERTRWLQSREDPKQRDEGESLAQIYDGIRGHQLVELTEVGLGERGLELAEEYSDLGAILDILEREGGDTNTIGPSIPARIQSYFTRFGSQWAEVYFTRCLGDGREAVNILNDNGHHKEHLTEFLRRHPEYAKLAWINEVSSERNYGLAAECLARAAAQSRDVWSQKVMLSMSKLSRLAAEASHQQTPDAIMGSTRKLEHRVSMLEIQEALRLFFQPQIENALDGEAALDLLMDRYGRSGLQGKPNLGGSLLRNLNEIFEMRPMHAFDLTDTLTLMSSDDDDTDPTSVLSRRFFLALKVLRSSSTVNVPPSKPSQSHDLQAKLVWRRVFLASDWTSFNHTELKDDQQLSNDTFETPLFQTLLEGYRIQDGPSGASFWTSMAPLSPSEVLGAAISLGDLRSLPQFVETGEDVLVGFLQEFKAEDESLRRQISDGRLEDWYQGILQAARAAARTEADRKGDKEARKHAFEDAFNARRGQQDKENFGSNGQTVDQEDGASEVTYDVEGNLDMEI